MADARKREPFKEAPHGMLRKEPLQELFGRQGGQTPLHGGTNQVNEGRKTRLSWASLGTWPTFGFPSQTCQLLCAHRPQGGARSPKQCLHQKHNLASIWNSGRDVASAAVIYELTTERCRDWLKHPESTCLCQQGDNNFSSLLNNAPSLMQPYYLKSGAFLFPF